MILMYKLVDGLPKGASIWERDTKTRLERCIWEDCEDNYRTEYSEWQSMAKIGEDTMPELVAKADTDCVRISKSDAFLEMI